MRSLRSLFMVVAAVAVCCAPAAAQTISPTAVLQGPINVTLDTKSTAPGTPFAISVQPPLPDSGLQGATVYGHVSQVTSASQGRKPKLSLAFDRIVFASGNAARLHAELLSAQVTQDQKSALRIAGGTIAGDIVGNIVGKAVGTNAGGFLGAAGGFLIANNYKANVHVNAGSIVKLQLDRQLTIR